MSAQVVLIPCGGGKRSTAHPAKYLYVGHHFRLGVRAALALTTEDRVRIVSARYGLVTLGRVIEPYEQKMGRPGCISGHEIAEQAVAQGLVGESVVSLLPRIYDNAVALAFPERERAFAGLTGIGWQRQALCRIAQQGRVAA